jgi:hypothetical protein
MFLGALIIPYMNYVASAASCSKSFLGLKTWFAYFPNDWFGGPGTINACDINQKFQLLAKPSGQSGLLLIGLAILDDLIRIAALVALAFVVTGGIQYITSQGSPDATSKAQQTIINALVGLVLAMLAAAIVSFIGARLGSVK